MEAMNPPEKRKVVIVDDHPLFREGIRSIVKEDGGYAVVGEAEGVRDALECVAGSGPDLLLTDLHLKDGSGIDLIRAIQERHPDVPVLVLSVNTDVDVILSCFRSGASAYMVKGSDAAMLLVGLGCACRKELFMCGRALRSVLDRALAAGPSPQPADAMPRDPLTRREREILTAIVHGESVPEIAQRLALSDKTILNHRTRIMRKLGLRTAVDLFRYASQQGLLEKSSTRG